MNTNPKQHVPIFLSSTYEDLQPHRKAVWDTLEKLKVGVSGMEVFGARSEEPLDTCLDEVSKCSVFIGILGMRYGSTHAEFGKSFVQLEYERAVQGELDILIYLIDEENAALAPKFVDTGDSARALADFKHLLRKKHTIDVFASPQDLAEKVERDLLRIFSAKRLNVEEDKLEPSVEPERTKDLLQRFDLMPGRLAGREVELIARFSGPARSVPRSTCNALGLEFGQSLSRPISVVHPPDLSEDFADCIYGQYAKCDFLSEAPADAEFKLIARLAFGDERGIVKRPHPHTLEALERGHLGYSTTIKDLETGEVFENYITHKPIKALILVKVLDNTE
jgi:hypothetical protein